MTAPRSPRGSVLPPVRTGDVSELQQLRKSMLEVLDRKVDVTTPLPELLLVSPAGFVYALRVSDNGSLTTELRATP